MASSCSLLPSACSPLTATEAAAAHILSPLPLPLPAGLCQIYGVPPLTLGIGSMAHEQLYWSVSRTVPALCFAARIDHRCC